MGPTAVSGERGVSGGVAMLRRSGLALALLFPLTAYCLPLTAQVPLSAQQTGFQRLRDSLAATSDTAALRALFHPARRSDPERAGLIGLRLGELRADPDFSDALSSFRQAAKRDPGRAEPWYGLGLAEAGRSRWEMRNKLNLGSRVGLGALTRSATSYARALDNNARFVPAALALAQVELALLDTARLRDARDALRRVSAAVAPGPPELLLALGRVERAAGSLDSAAIVFERYVLTGPNRGLGLLELARTRLALGRSDGDAPYYEGASLEDPAVADGYRADIRPVAADSVLYELDRLKGQSRAAYLHRFWTDRDHLELRPEGERLREHYRRVVFARRHFPLSISRRFYGRRDAYRSGNAEVDDRGVIYIRQGAPTERLRPFVFGAMPNETWRYVRAEGDMLFHFSSGYDGNGGGDLYDYRLVQSVLDLHGAADAPTDQLILSRQSLSPVYSRMLNWGRFGAANARAWERSIGATSIAVGTTTDSHELQFARRLAAVVDVVAVGRRPAGSVAHVIFGIAAPGTSGQPVPGGVEYPVRVRLVALDRQERSVGILDTTIVVRHQRKLSGSEWLVGRAELILPPGRWAYRAALSQGDSVGVVLPRDSVRVGNTDGASPELSDIALGSPGRAVSWITDRADTVLLAPASRFRQGSEVGLYYEVTGATPGTLYRHEVTVLRPGSRASDKRRPLVALSFDEEAADSTIRSHRTVRLEGLTEGSYVMEVKITRPDGISWLRQRPVHIIKSVSGPLTPTRSWPAASSSRRTPPG
jgi:GWxTD domain-containing protein